MSRLVRLLPAALLFAPVAQAATLSPFLVADQTRDAVLLATDLDGDGVISAAEVTTFFDGANGSGLTGAATNVFALRQLSDGSVLATDGDNDSVYRLRDTDGDGSAQGAGEARVWFSGAANAGGYRLNTPNGVAEGADGAVYVTEADTNGSPSGDKVFRTVDLNGDGDANDEGEATVWLDLTARSGTAVPFDIAFVGDTAYIADTDGGNPDLIYAARDANGDGRVTDDELTVFLDESAGFGLADFALDTDGTALYTFEWLAGDDGLHSVFRLADLDGNGVIDAADEAVEIWTSALLGDGYSILAGFGIAVESSTSLFLASNAGTDGGRSIYHLLDLNGDGDFLDAGETFAVLSALDAPGSLARPRDVAIYVPPAVPAPVPVPAALPLLAGGVALLAGLRRRRS